MGKGRELFCVFLAITFIFSQLGWAQVLSLQSQISKTVLFPELIGLKPGTNSIYFLWHDGNGELTSKISPDKAQFKQVLSYFFTGLSVPEKDWWVNLNVLIDESVSMGYGLAYTELGRVLIEADLKMKKIAMRLMNPDTPTGYALLERLETQGLKGISLRFWIEPKEIVVAGNEKCAILKKASLKVRAEVKGGPSLKKAIDEIIVPEIEKSINTTPEFAALRSVYKALILASWYKRHFKGRIPIVDKTIDSYATPNFLSSFWTRRQYLAKYNELYLKGLLEDSQFFSLSSGGFDGRKIPEASEKEEFPDDITKKDFSDEKFRLSRIGLVEGPASKPSRRPVMYLEGNVVDASGLKQTGPVAIVSEFSEPIVLSEEFEKLGIESKEIGNEIIWISSNGEIERIKAPGEGKRGIFISKTKAVVIDSEGKVLKKDFSSDKDLVSFGTAGWRFKLPKEGDEKAEKELLAKMELALEGFADYYWDHIGEIQKKYGERRFGVVVVRDSRRMGEKFVEEAKRVLSKRGIQVYAVNSNDVLPTPLAAYATHYYKAAFAINFTASHNPPDWSGFKVTPADGGPAEDEITLEMGKRINERIVGIKEESGRQVTPTRPMEIDKELLFNAYSKYVEDQLISILGKKVFEDLKQTFTSLNLKIVPTALYGAGGEVLLRALRSIFGENRVVANDLNADDLKMEPLSNFGDLKRPEPNEENTEFLTRWISENKPAIGVALDGDADRFAIRDTQGNYITPNQLIALIVYFLNDIGKNKGVVKTVPTSDFALAVARHFGAFSDEMKVGFKWAKQFWNDKKVGVIGEESAHIGLVGTKTYDDGILMSVFAILMASYFQSKYKKSLSEMVDYIQGEVLHRFFSYDRRNIQLEGNLKKDISKLISLVYSRSQGKAIVNNPKEQLDVINWEAIEKEAGKKIDKLILVDGIKFVFEDGSWFAIRLSGTEPVARLYVEGVSEDKKLAEKMMGKLAEVGKKFLKGNFCREKKREKKRKRLILSPLGRVDVGVFFYLAAIVLLASPLWWNSVVGFLKNNADVIIGGMGIIGCLVGLGWIGYKTGQYLSRAFLWVKDKTKTYFSEIKRHPDLEAFMAGLRPDIERAFSSYNKSDLREAAASWNVVIDKISKHWPILAKYLAATLILEGVMVDLPEVKGETVIRAYSDKIVAKKMMESVKDILSRSSVEKSDDLFKVAIDETFGSLEKRFVEPTWEFSSNYIMRVGNKAFFAWKLGDGSVYLGRKIGREEQDWLNEFLSKLEKKEVDVDNIVETLKKHLSLDKLSPEEREGIRTRFETGLRDLLNWNRFKHSKLLHRVVQVAMFLNALNLPSPLIDAALFMLLNAQDKVVGSRYAKGYYVAQGIKSDSGSESAWESTLSGVSTVGRGHGGIDLDKLSISFVW